jgi:DnaK suppressor protein
MIDSGYPSQTRLNCMEQDQLDTFRQALIVLRDEIEQLNNDSKEAAGIVQLDQSMVGRLSRIDALQAQQMAQETTRRRQHQLQRIHSALRRIGEDDYGYCFLCGEEIGVARLNIDPSITRCMECMGK